VFSHVGDVDLLLTGEMRHHDVLARKQRGTHVLLSEHTNSERAYLPRYAEALTARCPGLLVSVSALDCDPLMFV
jgi:putative NIF3 family GTP cyclohydrolase 1 type 2